MHGGYHPPSRASSPATAPTPQPDKENTVTMGHHESSNARRRRLVGWASLTGLAWIFLLQGSCGHLQAETDDGGPGPSSNGSSGSGGPSGSGSGSVSGSGSGGGSGAGSGSGSVAGSSSGSASGSGSSSGDVIIDGGLPDVVTKVACGSSTENLPYTPGYTPDPTVTAQAASLVTAMNGNKTELANQMRGTAPGTGANAFNDIYRTFDDPMAGIKGFEFRDGPRGVNLQAGQFTGATTNTGPLAYGNGYSTAFPVTVLRAASWDLDLENKIAMDVGDEMLASGNTMILAPCVNILRHPAWGRSQETYGEDSFLLGRMGSAYVAGVQQYVPACVKHYAGNNIEDGRANQNAQMDEQTLHEIYGRHFEMIIQDGGVACVMASYNSVNGTKSTQNPELLTTILRNTFNFQGFVLSDFWSMPGGQTIQTMSSLYSPVAQAGVNAGLDMELPWNLNYSVLESVANVQQLSTSAQRIIEQKLRFNVAKTGVSTQTLGLRPKGVTGLTTSLGANGIVGNEPHIADGVQMAQEGMVLLKNDKNTLPINRSSVHSIAVIGASVPYTLTNPKGTFTFNFATDPRIGDLGSSRVLPDPAKAVGPFAGIMQGAGSGITVTSGTSASAAASADFVVVIAGMTPQDEGEEYTGAGDRTDATGNPNFSLDAKSGTNTQNNLITAVAALNKPMVVVLEGGSAINMPWLSSVPAVVMAWYPGQAGGTALAKLLFGDANFSGKLPITWPKSEADEPPFNQGGTSGGTTMMGYYLGYRYFDQNNKTPLFAFGSGLSYATFKYQVLGVPCSTVAKNGVVDVSVAITNTGTVPGNEVSFLFVSRPSSQVPQRSLKELKGFHRTTAPVNPGETVQFTIPLRVADLKYWNTSSNPPGWTVESGTVQIMVGPSSDNLPLKDTMQVQ
jgi:beta-glucosidase